LATVRSTILSFLIMSVLDNVLAGAQALAGAAF
jgi:hypothetical protein